MLPAVCRNNLEPPREAGARRAIFPAHLVDDILVYFHLNAVFSRLYDNINLFHPENKKTAMLTTPPNTPPGQKSTYIPSPNPDPPSSLLSPNPTSVDATYQIVRIKPAKAGWLTSNPSDLVHIKGPLSEGNTSICDFEEEAEDNGFKIPCVAWRDRLIHLTCLYNPSASIFTDFGGYADETVNTADEAEPIKSLTVKMQKAIFGEESTGEKRVEDEDMRDDGGNPFMVLHVNKGFIGVNKGFIGSARLYCKKFADSQDGLTDGVDENLGLDKSDEGMGDVVDAAG